jgi:hypothetical protein
MIKFIYDFTISILFIYIPEICFYIKQQQMGSIKASSKNKKNKV